MHAMLGIVHSAQSLRTCSDIFEGGFLSSTEYNVQGFAMHMEWVRPLLLTTSVLMAASAQGESTAILSVNAQGQAANGGSVG